jgi:hypothetical protein
MHQKIRELITSYWLWQENKDLYLSLLVLFVPGSANTSSLKIPTLMAESNMEQKRKFQNKPIILT